MFVPTKVFLTKGVGIHKHKLSSFEMALRDASIAEFNLVRVSSIFPPRCKLTPKRSGLKLLSAGQIVFCVLADIATNEPHRLLGSAVGLAIPKDTNRYGYLSEHHSYGETKDKVGDYAEDLAASMLAKIIGVEFDPDLSYDKKKEIWKIDGKIFKTTNITQTATGHKDGLWTTVVAGAILIP
jgi:arginine decarboxylase